MPLAPGAGTLKSIRPEGQSVDIQEVVRNRSLGRHELQLSAAKIATQTLLAPDVRHG
jgi:hypothetical protein